MGFGTLVNLIIGVLFIGMAMLVVCLLAYTGNMNRELMRVRDDNIACIKEIVQLRKDVLVMQGDSHAQD